MKKLAKRITGKEWGMIVLTILFTCFSVYLELEVSPSDKRAKFVRLTDKSRSQMQKVKAFFDRIDQSLLEGVSKSDLAIFEKVLGQLQENVEKIGGENEETR